MWTRETRGRTAELGRNTKCYPSEWIHSGEHVTKGTVMLTAQVMVTDYSGAAFEYTALHSRPTVFVDLPKKVLNPN